MVQGIPLATVPTEILTEIIDGRQAKVIPLNELKERLEEQEGVLFKQFSSITDYHSTLFELGVLPKRLRSASDRSKYYRLIEASLYGGISSAITAHYVIICCQKTVGYVKHSKIWKRLCVKTFNIRSHSCHSIRPRLIQAFD